MKNIKLPNSYGGVIKMGNASRRRRPYMVRITTGYEINEKTGKSKQIIVLLHLEKFMSNGLKKSLKMLLNLQSMVIVLHIIHVHYYLKEHLEN